jgi:hypothetical protein
LVDPWQNKLFLWTGRVEVGLVDAHPPGLFLLLNQDWICQPSGVLDRPDETGGEEPIDFFANRVVSLRVEGMEQLLHSSDIWVDV